MVLTKLRRMFKESKETLSKFDLQSTVHRNEILRLLQASKNPELSVHFEILGSIPQILQLNGLTSHHHPSSPSKDAPQKGTTPSDPSLVQASNPRPRDPAKIYAIGSYTKILINLAWAEAVKDEKFKQLGLSWQKSACDLFNELRTAAGKSTIERLHGNPTIRQLLLHENGLAPMNRLLLAPDGQFIMSAEEFLVDGPLVTEDRYKNEYPHRGWVEYSNGNHIFAGMILEELTGLKLSQALDVLVLQRLNLKSTILDQESLLRHTAQSPAAEPLVRGFQISSRGELTGLESPRYLADTIEVASFGAWSSLEALATINRELLNGAEGLKTGKFTYGEVDDFLTLGPPLFPDENASTLCGCFSSLHSELLGIESPSRMLLRHERYESYQLGQRRHGPPANAYHKAGYIDGFSTNVYLVPKYRTFVVVISNATGPIDVAHHVARYILQEAFSLLPRQKVVDLALKEGMICAEFLRTLEQSDTVREEMVRDVAPLAGTYRHNRFGQMITVYPDGFARIHGDVKSSSHMRIVYRSPSTIRLFPGSHAFGIDRWGEWNDLDFDIEIVDGNRNLVGSHGQHRYKFIAR